MKQLALALALVLMPAAAEASTLPRVDFDAGNRMLAVGALDASFDYAFTDRLSLGVSLVPYPSTSIAWFDPLLSPLNASVRGTYRVGEVLGMPVGVSLSAGVNQTIISTAAVGAPSLNPFPGLPLLRFEYLAYVQPALNVARPLGAGWTVRATLGPLIIVDPGHRGVLPLWPNVEFSKQLGEHHELTLLGNSLVGWRGTF